MIRIFILALGYLIFLASNAYAVDVQEVDMGACWALQTGTNDGRNVWRVASFNDDKNFIYGLSNQLADATTEELKKAFKTFGPSHFEVYLHCNSVGHSLFINFYDAKVPVCVWANRSENTNYEFTIKQVVPNPYGQANQPCQGVVPAELILTEKQGTTSRALVIYLRAKYGRYIQKIDARDSSGMVVVTLKKKLRFHEIEVRDLWANDEFLKRWVDSVGYDPWAIIVGGFLKLDEGTYPGF